MPSKRTIALIVFFWLLTTGYVAYRDLWPRLFASSSPTIAIDLADEAAQNVAIRWNIYRDGVPIGRLTSHLEYNKANDTFVFKNEYKQLTLEISPVKVVIPALETKDTITRAGDLREQSLLGNIEFYLLGSKFVDGSAKIEGTVINGQLCATCDFRSTLLGDFLETLDPVPVPSGLPLNPLQPLNRLTNLKPGHSWYVQKSSPLEDAIAAVLRKKLVERGIKFKESKEGRLFARVLPELQGLDWRDHAGVPCWVIEYQLDEPVARTWVRASDGKVLKQEAFFKDEHLMIVREQEAW